MEKPNDTSLAPINGISALTKLFPAGKAQKIISYLLKDSRGYWLTFLFASIFIMVLLPAGGHGVLWAASEAEAKKDLPAAAYHYDPNKKADPFWSFLEREMMLQKKAEQARVTSMFPLQRAGVEHFNLVGIAGEAQHRFAVVEAKGGALRFYPVKVGTVIGLYDGRVVEIADDRIVIEEVRKKRDGQEIKRIVKKLRRDENEGAP